MDKLQLLKDILEYYNITYKIYPEGNVKEIHKTANTTSIIWHPSTHNALASWLPTMIETNKNLYETGDIPDIYNTWSKQQIDFIKENCSNIKSKFNYETEYDDFTLKTNKLEIGSPITIEYHNDDGNTTNTGIITHMYTRSDDEKFYDGEYDLFAKYNGYYDVAGEFITNDDIYYVFVSENETIQIEKNHN